MDGQLPCENDVSLNQVSPGHGYGDTHVVTNMYGTPSANIYLVVRLAEIAGQAIRWLFFSYFGYLSFKVVVEGWVEINKQTLEWWQSPVAAIIAAAVPASAFATTLAVLLVFRRRTSTQKNGDQVVMTEIQFGSTSHRRETARKGKQN